jgi:hypothetical protein
VSFAGEADVAIALATMQGKSQLLPVSLRNLISETWFKWRLCLRIEQITTSSSSSTPPLDRLDLALPVEDLIRPLWPLMSEEFHAAAIAEARAAGMRCNIVVVDGNAKNRRAVCAAALTQVIVDRKLNKIIRAGCPHTPQLGQTCCPQHEASRNAARPADVEIVDHRVPATALQSASSALIFLVKEHGGLQREAWIEEGVIDAGMVTSYLRSIGEDKLATQASKRLRSISSTATSSAVVPSLSSPGIALAQAAEVLPLESAAADLESVACGTHKEGMSAQRSLAKSAGILCAVLSSGIVVLVREIFGSESLSQRYLFISNLVDALPELTVVVHDDACHLFKFSSSRAHESEQAARLAQPRMQYICDPFHMTGHVDQWCKDNCDPKLPARAQTLKGVRSSVCEFTFTWLSQYKHQTKHMNEWGFKFFLGEMIRSHNDIIFQGGYRARTRV